MYQCNPDKSNGFTLLELMLVCLVLSLLSAVVYPTFSEHARRADRASAIAALYEAQHYMEHFHAVNDAYDRDKFNAPVQLPAHLKSVPSQTGKYELTIESLSPHAYTLAAQPRFNDDCGKLILTSTGIKGNSSAQSKADACWR